MRWGISINPHSPEFRRRAIERVRRRAKSMAKIALELAIGETTLRRWVRRDDENYGEPGPAVRHEVHALRQEVGQLVVEVELLKRAMANSAPLPRRGF